MICLNGKEVKINHFPDGTLLIKEFASGEAEIEWKFENNEELVVLIFITKHLRSHGVTDIVLVMPYIPNARQDRVKKDEDVFTLKYFSEVINSLNFKRVEVLDPHSSVSAALIDRIDIKSPVGYIERAIDRIGDSDLIVFYPDEGSVKRYSDLIVKPYAFGIKNRDWATGEIKGLTVINNGNDIKGRNILIVDDISSRGGTFYYSAKALHELGAGSIYLYVTHCENTILEGKVLEGDLIKQVFTTDSLFTGRHDKIKTFGVFCSKLVDARERFKGDFDD